MKGRGYSAAHSRQGNMNEDWLAVIVGLGLVALVAVRLVAQVPW